MGNQSRKATKQEMAHARRVIREAFSEFVPVFGAHSDYGGHRAPRDHTIAFRLQDEHGKFRSNVICPLRTNDGNANKVAAGPGHKGRKDVLPSLQ